MKEWSPLTIGLVAGAVAILVAASALAYRRLRRRKDPAELERQRRLFLTRSGRIIMGEMVDVVEAKESGALMLVYRYDVAGVTYEVSQDVAMVIDAGILAGRAIGGILSVRYDMRQPSNSIVISEEWSGLPNIKPGTSGLVLPSGQAGQKS